MDNIGHYRIVRQLGAGGMGEVWRATDSKLGRDVALKLLPPAFASDAMRLARFAREARVLAALNHPNLAVIHGVEERALVMELVEGETLAARIARGPLTPEEATAVAAQIADGLEYAHERGIVHRDLKPANIMLTPEGRVKILDFGLAKAMAAETSTVEELSAPTLSSPATLAGAILGTAAYMAPEQAKGKAVDRRADIWAWGAVLYEMLTGRRAFAGEDVTDTLAAVLRSEPELAELPQPAQAVVARCLMKDPKLRWGCIGDARHALQQPAAPAGVAAPAVTAWRWALAAAAVALLAGGGLAWWLKPPPRIMQLLMAQFDYSLPQGQTFVRAGRHEVAISPDGSKIVYVANRTLYLRPLDQLKGEPIPGSDVDPYEPVLSPDGQWVAFFVPGSPDTLEKIAVGGGVPVTLCQLKGKVAGASWSGSRIVFGDDAPDGGGGYAAIEAVSENGGTPQVLTTAEGNELAAAPELVDGGRRLLFSLMERSAPRGGDAEIVLQELGSGHRQILSRGGHDPRLLRGGMITYLNNGTVFGLPFDSERRQVTGGPVPLVAGVYDIGFGGIGQYAVAAATGTLVYRPGPASAGAANALVFVDAQGHERPTGAPANDYRSPRFSPDGKLIAVNVAAQAIWIWDVQRSTLSKLADGAGAPGWSPDGRYVYYNVGTGNDLYRKRADGAGAAELVAAHAGPVQSISPDGKYALLVGSQLPLLRLQLGAEPQLLLPAATYSRLDAAISPDGHWIAYPSLQSGAPQIYVRPFPNANDGRWRISTKVSVGPRWSRDGRRLYFANSSAPGVFENMVEVPITTSPAFRPGTAKPLFPAGPYRDWDVGPDGQFVMVRGADAAAASRREELVVVTNWGPVMAARVGH